ncbi:hypothetical protein LshimejAT787_0112260 [Lyophyllum shimeji]|uniref:Uncharacterized protein n=1 Tax=Lyophyllum shimeji TaxID=47721 RepID=A0A9P3PEB0_LYOSH|nr:hypothetical protein LshimejAT787_0112260 [Lyophyllum shimeji]
MTLSAARLVKYMGFVKLVVAGIMAMRPQVLYHSPLAKKISALTGLPPSDASRAPELNQAVACMVAAIGVGHLVAAQSGPAALASVFALDATWAALTLLSCLAAPRAWALGSPTLLLTACTHTVFCVTLWVLDPGLLSAAGALLSNAAKKSA